MATLSLSRLALVVCALLSFACGSSGNETNSRPEQDGGADGAPPDGSLPDGVFESDDPTKKKEIPFDPSDPETFGGDDGVNPGELAAEYDVSMLEGGRL